jgi:hypothetical protein
MMKMSVRKPVLLNTELLIYVQTNQVVAAKKSPGKTHKDVLIRYPERG